MRSIFVGTCRMAVEHLRHRAELCGGGGGGGDDGGVADADGDVLPGDPVGRPRGDGLPFPSSSGTIYDRVHRTHLAKSLKFVNVLFNYSRNPSASPWINKRNGK